jgi:hypothetical protein
MPPARLALAALLALGGCAEPTPAYDATIASTDSELSGGDGIVATAPAVGRTFLLDLDSAAIQPPAGHPGALVYLPVKFDPTPPLSVVVYIHGWHNCVENVVRAKNGTCSGTGGTHYAYDLAGQLEASRKNALLLVPEVAFEKASSAAGHLAEQDGLKNLLGETLGKLGDTVGGATVDDVGQLIVASHSGGYIAAAGIAERGGVPVSEVWLFDSLYGNTADYDQWVTDNIDATAGDQPYYRFADIYTGFAGTMGNSQSMATRAKGWFPSDSGTVIDDRSGSTWPLSNYHHGALFKRSGLPHDGVPKFYFVRMLLTSALPDVN